MDRLHALQVFVAVADAGSFARAAARLRLSPPAVTRAVAALEERLGARLFSRTTRSLAITDVGQRLLASARQILADLETAEQEAVGAAAAPQGHLVVTASVTFGRTALAPVVCAFLDQYPNVSAAVLLLDRVVNLVEEGVDVAVRIGHLPDSSHTARRVGAVRRLLVASPGYLDQHGTPEAPSDLHRHAVIALTGLMPRGDWRHLDGGRTTSLALRPRLELNDAVAAIEAAQAGHGITLALSYMVSEEIRDGSLVPVLDGFALPPEPVHLVYPEVRLLAPKIRAFVDFAAPRLEAFLEERALATLALVPALLLLPRQLGQLG